jgi:hypothetical protein
MIRRAKPPMRELYPYYWRAAELSEEMECKVYVCLCGDTIQWGKRVNGQAIAMFSNGRLLWEEKE